MRLFACADWFDLSWSQISVSVYVFSRCDTYICSGITVDWITDVVYWTDAAYNAIFAVSMAHPNIAETIIENLDEPYGIAAHPWKG